MLKSGHKELQVTIENGSAHLAELCAAMSRDKRRFGDFDEEKLAALLRETDREGRFEVRDGRVRKIDKQERQPRAAAEPTAVAVFARRGADGSAACSPGSPRRRSRSRSAGGFDEDDEDLAQLASRSLNVAGEVEVRVEVIDAAEAEEALVANALNATSQEFDEEAADYTVADPLAEPEMNDDPAPARPPGQFWVKFNDEGSVWWYYEGPKGKWWCTVADMQPKPYED